MLSLKTWLKLCLLKIRLNRTLGMLRWIIDDIEQKQRTIAKERVQLEEKRRKLML